MGVKLIVPNSIWGGFYKKFKWGAFGFLAHSLQCDQRWLFLIRIGKRRFGYRTMGDATPDILTSQDSGFHFPWQKKSISGRG